MNAAHSATFDTMTGHSRSHADSLARVALVAKLLDNAFLIPGLNRRVGLDAVIGLVPGIGDAVTAVLASYIIWEARRLGLPRWKIARMVGNVCVDTAIGAIPFAGDVFDVFYKSNQRNLRIIHEHLGISRRGPSQIDGTAVRVDGR
ncbi:DUF4112 domain-containing protein [Microvirga antarctica]|uniref:DUF4112 domain-containing protein n=1 Tax=Microvirga antarctica TaxID=2819233 RepID=UPI001B30A010|nr:DUF4112 domain-containing protein [Microvirga antarctica]